MRGFWRHGISERVTGLNRASADALSRINRFLWRSGAERESPNSPRIILFYFAADASSLSLHPYLASLYPAPRSQNRRHSSRQSFVAHAALKHPL